MTLGNITDALVTHAHMHTASNRHDNDCKKPRVVSIPPYRPKLPNLPVDASIWQAECPRNIADGSTVCMDIRSIAVGMKPAEIVSKMSKKVK